MLLHLSLASSCLLGVTQSEAGSANLRIAIDVAAAVCEELHLVTTDRTGPGSVFIVAGDTDILVGDGAGIAAHDEVAALGRDGGS